MDIASPVLLHSATSFGLKTGVFKEKVGLIQSKSTPFFALSVGENGLFAGNGLVFAVCRFVFISYRFIFTVKFL